MKSTYFSILHFLSKNAIIVVVAVELKKLYFFS